MIGRLLIRQKNVGDWLFEFQKMSREGETPNKEAKHYEHRVTSTEGWFKLNTNGSVVSALGKAGVGGVVRDYAGVWDLKNRIFIDS